jgi:hypothetical protein
MKLVALLALWILTNCVFILVYLNRESEKLLNAVVPIATASIAAIIIGGFVLGGLPTRSEVFSAEFQVQLKNKMPVELPWALRWRRPTQSLFEPAALFKKNPKYFEGNGVPTTLYHHLLQKAIIDWMGFNYRSGWQVELTQFDLPSAQVRTSGPSPALEGPKGDFYSSEQIAELLSGNYFARVDVGIPPEFVLPPGTQFSINPPTEKAGAEIGTIRLRNRYCTVLVTTTFSSYMRGIGGYKQLAGLSQVQDEELGSISFLVRINVKYNPVLSGSPDAMKIKRWADQLVDGLRGQFDEERIWAQTKSDYLFRKQVDFFGPVRDDLPPQ